MTEFERLRRDYGWQIGDHASFSEGVWAAGQPVKVSYPDESRAALAEIEARSFWFKHRNRVILKLFGRYGRPAALWEVGSGNGFVAWNLQQQGLAVVAVEPGLEGARQAAKRGVQHNVAATLEELQLPDACLPAVGFFDVLEHLEQPEPFLCECRRVLKPEGVAAVTVPAFPLLWSQADEDAGHFRRYTPRTLDKAMEQAGFERVRSGYMMMSMWIPLFLMRSVPYRLGRRRSKDANLNAYVAQLAPRQGIGSALVAAVLSVELAMDRWLPIPWGSSVIGLYRKRAHF